MIQVHSSSAPSKCLFINCVINSFFQLFRCWNVLTTNMIFARVKKVWAIETARACCSLLLESQNTESQSPNICEFVPAPAFVYMLSNKEDRLCLMFTCWHIVYSPTLVSASWAPLSHRTSGCYITTAACLCERVQIFSAAALDIFCSGWGQLHVCPVSVPTGDCWPRRCGCLGRAGGAKLPVVAGVELRGPVLARHSALWSSRPGCGAAACGQLQRSFTVTEKAPTRAFSWLKVTTTAFTFKTLIMLNGHWSHGK